MPEKGQLEKVHNGMKNAAHIMLVIGSLALGAPGALISLGLQTYASIYGCTDFTCTQKACDNQCLFDNIKEWTNQAITHALEEYHDDELKQRLAGALSLMQEYYD